MPWRLAVQRKLSGGPRCAGSSGRGARLCGESRRRPHGRVPGLLPAAGAVRRGAAAPRGAPLAGAAGAAGAAAGRRRAAAPLLARPLAGAPALGVLQAARAQSLQCAHATHEHTDNRLARIHCKPPAGPPAYVLLRPAPSPAPPRSSPHQGKERPAPSQRGPARTGRRAGPGRRGLCSSSPSPSPRHSGGGGCSTPGGGPVPGRRHGRSPPSPGRRPGAGGRLGAPGALGLTENAAPSSTRRLRMGPTCPGEPACGPAARVAGLRRALLRAERGAGQAHACLRSCPRAAVKMAHQARLTLVDNESCVLRRAGTRRPGRGG